MADYTHRPGPEGIPFVKWAGGKTDLLEQYRALFPRQRVNTYFEPFVGSGAVFFELRAQGIAERYVLSDANEELVNAYRVVRDRLDELLAMLDFHQQRHSRSHYYAVRAIDRARDWPYNYDVVVRAARMIYLNKTCYNGLWRVNKKGQFNTPMGRHKNPPICDVGRLQAASAALRGVSITCSAVEEAMRDAGAGDFVYFDPPYVPLTDTADFTAYYAGGFGAEDQRRLAGIFRSLDRNRCMVMLSNSDVPYVHDLYNGFRVETVTASRRINRRADKRGLVTEVVVLNY